MSMKIQTFETILIFHEKLTDTEYEEAINEYIRLLKGLPAAKLKTDKLGKKNLAYKTRGCTQGWYVVFTYESTEDLVNHKLDLILRKDDKVIKFLTIKLTEDEATQYNVIALWKYVENNSKKHHDPKMQSIFKIELHNKFAFPFTTLVLVLLGVPLAITPPRVRYNRGFLFSILIIFLYYLLRALSLSLGEEMKITPLLAAWIPNLILFILGSILYYKKVYTIN